MRFRRVHLVGIGGAGMSAIARILLARGVEVSGSDAVSSPVTDDIARRGGRVFIGHAPGQAGDAECVVVSSAVSPDNPEVEDARRRGIPVWPRARMLAELMASSRGIAIAGTHGKTTTSAMIGFALTEAGLDPTVLIGADLPAFGSNARPGNGPFTVAEADESDRSLLLLSPEVAVVTNVEEDHLEQFNGIEDICATFAAFLRRLPPTGLAVLWSGNPRMQALAEAAPCPVVFYGAEGSWGAGAARYRATDVHVGPAGSFCRVWAGEALLGSLSLSVPGRHNILNALAAVAVATELGVSWDAVRDALVRFRLPARRFEVLGERAGVLVVDDYAHHPTEVRATLAAARTTGRRVLAVFQPHRYTRTQKLGAAFGACFGDADLVLVTDIYPAGEAPIPGVSAESIVRSVERAGGPPVLYVPSVEEVPAALLRHVRAGDLVLTMGAGDVRRAGLALLAQLERLELGNGEGSPAWTPEGSYPRGGVVKG